MTRCLAAAAALVLIAAATASAAVTVAPGWPRAVPGGTVHAGPGGGVVVVTDLARSATVRAFTIRGQRLWRQSSTFGCGNCDDGPQPEALQPDGTYGPIGVEGDDSWAVDARGRRVAGCVGVVSPDGGCVVGPPRRVDRPPPGLHGQARDRRAVARRGPPVALVPRERRAADGRRRRGRGRLRRLPVLRGDRDGAGRRRRPHGARPGHADDPVAAGRPGASARRAPVGRPRRGGRWRDGLRPRRRGPLAPRRHGRPGASRPAAPWWTADEAGSTSAASERERRASPRSTPGQARSSGGRVPPIAPACCRWAAGGRVYVAVDATGRRAVRGLRLATGATAWERRTSLPVRGARELAGGRVAVSAGQQFRPTTSDRLTVLVPG